MKRGEVPPYSGQRQKFISEAKAQTTGVVVQVPFQDSQLLKFLEELKQSEDEAAQGEMLAQ